MDEQLTMNLKHLFKDTPDWEGVVLHYSQTKDRLLNDWKAINRHHVVVNGWSDNGYHLGLEVDGGKLVYKIGRPLYRMGAHALQFNGTHIGVCLVGNYDLMPPTKSQLFFLASMVREIQRIKLIKKKKIIGHRETYKILGVPVVKTCPGKMFDLDAFRDMLL